MNDSKLSIYKYCYDFWKQSKWNTNKLINIENAVGIKDDELASKVIRSYAKSYAINELNITENEFYDEIIKSIVGNSKDKKKQKNYFKLLELLSDLDIEDEKQLTKLVITNKGKVNIEKLKDIIESYSTTYRQNEPNLKEDLKKKITIYQEIDRQIKEEEKEKKEQNTLEVALTFISAFIDSDYSDKDLFCKEINLPLNKFNQYTKLVKENDNDMYEEYQKKFKK